MKLRALALLVVLCGTVQAERLRAPDGTVKEVPEASVDFALKDGYTRLGTVYFRRQDNTVAELYDEPEAIAYGEREGWWRMTQAEIDVYIRQRAEESANRIGDEARDEVERAKWYRQPWIVLMVAAFVGIAAALMFWPSIRLRK